jgi:hypothetical protein
MLSKSLSLVSKNRSIIIPNAIKAFGSGTKFEKFDYIDPLCLEAHLTEEEKMVRDSARQFA